MNGVLDGAIMMSSWFLKWLASSSATLSATVIAPRPRSRHGLASTQPRYVGGVSAAERPPGVSAASASMAEGNAECAA